MGQFTMREYMSTKKKKKAKPTEPAAAYNMVMYHSPIIVAIKKSVSNCFVPNSTPDLLIKTQRLVIMFCFLLYVNKHRNILGAAGHILTPANQLMVMGLKIWSLASDNVSM
jgi:hypothetical protein